MWYIVQCKRISCSKHMIVAGGSKRKKCPYCGRSFKVDDNFINSYVDQETARKMVKLFNSRLI